MEEILKLIDAYWRFDANQQPMSRWHEKQALLEVIKSKIDSKTSFKLSTSEEKEFKESGSKAIKFEIGGGIGIGVFYKKKNGKWKDITDYKNW